jgi:hypothetical protein
MTCYPQGKMWYTRRGELLVTSLSNKLAFTLGSSLALFLSSLKHPLFYYFIFERKGTVHE